MEKQKKKDMLSDIILLFVVIMLAVVVGLYAYPSIAKTLNIDGENHTTEQEESSILKETSPQHRKHISSIQYDEEENEVIIDGNVPIVNGSTSFMTKNTIKSSLDAFIATLTIIDDSEVSYSIITDNYTDNYSKPGEYIVEVKFEDSFGNFTMVELTIMVKDCVAPTFYNFSGKSTNSISVIKSQNSLLTVDEILKNITCIDDVDGQITKFEIISDGYTGNGDKAGSYLVKIKAVDNYENESYLNITVKVCDLKNVVVYDSKKIFVSAAIKLTKDDISKILYECGYYSNETTTYITVKFDEYLESYDTPNTYSAECNLNSTNGENKTVYLTLEVLEADKSDVVSNSSSLIIRILSSFWEFIKKIFGFLGDLLEKIF